jgi:predicted kinase
MSPWIDRPTQHEPARQLDSAVAAHERRARLIAQLREQAIAAAINDLSAPQNAIKAGITKHARWQKADRVIATAILKMIAAAILIAALGCILLALQL